MYDNFPPGGDEMELLLDFIYIYKVVLELDILLFNLSEIIVFCLIYFGRWTKDKFKWLCIKVLLKIIPEGYLKKSMWLKKCMLKIEYGLFETRRN